MKATESSKRRPRSPWWPAPLAIREKSWQGGAAHHRTIGLQHDSCHVLWRVASAVLDPARAWSSRPGPCRPGLPPRPPRRGRPKSRSVGSCPNAVEGGQQDEVSPARAVSAEARAFGCGLVGYRSRRAGPGPVMSLSAGFLGLAATGRARRPVLVGVGAQDWSDQFAQWPSWRLSAPFVCPPRHSLEEGRNVGHDARRDLLEGTALPHFHGERRRCRGPVLDQGLDVHIPGAGFPEAQAHPAGAVKGPCQSLLPRAAILQRTKISGPALASSGVFPSKRVTRRTAAPFNGTGAPEAMP